MDIPYWLISGGVNANGLQLVHGLVGNPDAREEDRQSYDESINIVMEDNVSMLSAIAEVTEPLSEAPDNTPSQNLEEHEREEGSPDKKSTPKLEEKSQSESKSLVADFHGLLAEPQTEEPCVEETVQLRVQQQKSFESFGDQSSVAEVSEISLDGGDKKKIENLVDELIGGISVFEAHTTEEAAGDAKTEEVAREAKTEEPQEVVVAKRTVVIEEVQTGQSFDQRMTDYLNRLRKEVAGPDVVQKTELKEEPEIVEEERKQEPGNADENLPVTQVNVESDPSSPTKRRSSLAKLDELIEQLTIPEDQSSPVDAEQISPIGQEVISDQEVTLDQNASVNQDINNNQNPTTPQPIKTVSTEDGYQSDTYQPKSREESPNTGNDPTYSTVLESAYNRLEDVEPVHKTEDDEYLSDSFQPKSREESPNATTDPLYQATLEKGYNEERDLKSEPILSGDFKSADGEVEENEEKIEDGIGEPKNEDSTLPPDSGIEQNLPKINVQMSEAQIDIKNLSEVHGSQDNNQDMLPSDILNLSEVQNLDDQNTLPSDILNLSEVQDLLQTDQKIEKEEVGPNSTEEIDVKVIPEISEQTPSEMPDFPAFHPSSQLNPTQLTPNESFSSLPTDIVTPIVHGGLTTTGHSLICGIASIKLSTLQDKSEAQRDSTPQVSNDPACEDEIGDAMVQELEEDEPVEEYRELDEKAQEKIEEPTELGNEEKAQEKPTSKDHEKTPELKEVPQNPEPKEVPSKSELVGVASPEVMDENKLEEISESEARELRYSTPDEQPRVPDSNDAPTPVLSDPKHRDPSATRTPAPFIKHDVHVAARQLVPCLDDDVRLRQKGQLPPDGEIERRRSSLELPATPQPFPHKQPVPNNAEQLLQVRLDEPLAIQLTQPLSIAPPSPGACLFQKSFHSATSPSLNWHSPQLATASSGQSTDPKVNYLLSTILLRLRHLKMDDPTKHENIVSRLHALETEMAQQSSGLPPDPELTEIVGKILSSDYPHADLQIVVSTSRKTTSSTQFYETETPGMVGLAPEQLRELQAKLMQKISGPTDFGHAEESKEQPDNLKQRDATEEGWTSADGKESVTKRSIRQVTTTHSDITGAGEHAPPKDDSDTSSVSSVRDRIQHFETLKQTSTIPIKRSAEAAIVEEPLIVSADAQQSATHLDSGSTQIEPHMQAKADELLAYKQEHELEHAGQIPQSVVKEQISHVPTATAAETQPVMTPEEQASVHTLIQKFSHPAEYAATHDKPHEEMREHVDTTPTTSESIIHEHYEYQPQTETHHEASESQPATEEIAQQIKREAPSIQADVPVQLSGQIPEDQTVTVTEKEHRVESAMSMQSEQGQPEFEEYKQEPTLIDPTQHHQVKFESAVEMPAPEKKLMPTDEELKTKIAEGVEEYGGESATDTKHIPIQRVVTSELTEQDYTTADTSQEPSKLDLTDETEKRPGEHVSETIPDVHRDTHLREEPTREQTNIEPVFVTHEVSAVQEGAPAEVQYQLDDSTQIIVQQEEPKVQEAPDRESPIRESTIEEKRVQESPEVSISHEQELARPHELGHGVEASLQETPEHYESFGAQSPEREKRHLTEFDQPHEISIKHETPEVEMGTESGEQSRTVPVNRALTEQSFDDETRDLLHTKSQLSESPSELSLKSESTVIHVQPGEVRQASADESPSRVEQTSLEASTPESFTEKQIVTPVEELPKEAQLEAIARREAEHKHEVGTPVEVGSPTYAKEELHFEASKSPEPHTYEVRQVDEHRTIESRPIGEAISSGTAEHARISPTQVQQELTEQRGFEERYSPKTEEHEGHIPKIEEHERHSLKEAQFVEPQHEAKFQELPSEQTHKTPAPEQVHEQTPRESDDASVRAQSSPRYDEEREPLIESERSDFEEEKVHVSHESPVEVKKAVSEERPFSIERMVETPEKVEQRHEESPAEGQQAEERYEESPAYHKEEEGPRSPATSETEERVQEGQKMGIGTMILGAAALGAKAAFDKISDALQKDDETGYQQIDESYKSSASPTESKLTPNEEHKHFDDSSPIESQILDSHATNEDLQSPATVASSFPGDHEPQQASPVSDRVVHEEFQHEEIPVDSAPIEHEASRRPADTETRFGVVESEPVEYYEEQQSTHIDRPISDALRTETEHEVVESEPLEQPQEEQSSHVDRPTSDALKTEHEEFGVEAPGKVSDELVVESQDVHELESYDVRPTTPIKATVDDQQIIESAGVEESEEASPGHETTLPTQQSPTLPVQEDIVESRPVEQTEEEFRPDSSDLLHKQEEAHDELPSDVVESSPVQHEQVTSPELHKHEEVHDPSPKTAQQVGSPELVESQSIEHESPTVGIESPTTHTQQKVPPSIMEQSMYEPGVVESEEVPSDWIQQETVPSPAQLSPTSEQLVESQDVAEKPAPVDRTHEVQISPEEIVESEDILQALPSDRRISATIEDKQEAQVESGKFASPGVDYLPTDDEIIESEDVLHGSPQQTEVDEFGHAETQKSPVQQQFEAQPKHEDEFVVESEEILPESPQRQLSPEKLHQIEHVAGHEVQKSPTQSQQSEFVVESEDVLHGSSQQTEASEFGHAEAQPKHEDEFVVESEEVTAESPQRQLSPESQQFEHADRHAEAQKSPVQQQFEAQPKHEDEFVVESEEILPESPQRQLSPEKLHEQQIEHVAEHEAQKSPTQSQQSEFVVESEDVLHGSSQQKAAESPIQQQFIVESEEVMAESPQRQLSPENLAEDITGHVAEVPETPAIPEHKTEELVESRQIEYGTDLATEHDTTLDQSQLVESEAIPHESALEATFEEPAERKISRHEHRPSIDVISEPTKQFDEHEEIEPYQSLPPEPRQEFEEEEEEPSKMGLGMMILGAAALGAKAVGEGVMDLGEKIGETIKEKLADHPDESQQEPEVKPPEVIEKLSLKDIDQVRQTPDDFDTPKTQLTTLDDQVSVASQLGSERAQSERIEDLKESASVSDVVELESQPESMRQEPIQVEEQQIVSERTEPESLEVTERHSPAQLTPESTGRQIPAESPVGIKIEAESPTSQQRILTEETGSNISLAGSDRVPSEQAIYTEPQSYETEAEVESRVVESQYEPHITDQIVHEKTGAGQVETGSNASLVGSTLSEKIEESSQSASEQPIYPEQQKPSVFETEAEVESRVIEHQYEPHVTDQIVHEKSGTEKIETESNESLVGSDRVEQLPAESIKEELSSDKELPVSAQEQPPIQSVHDQPPSPFEEEIEILEKDEFLGDYGQEPTREQPTIIPEQPHEEVHEEIEESHDIAQKSPDQLEESFDLLPDAEEILDTEADDRESTNQPSPEQLKAHVKPMETPHSTPAIEIYPHEEESAHLPEEELTKKLSDVYSMEEAERIAREAVEHGTMESQQRISEQQEEELPPLRPDYSRLMQEEFGRSESAGSELNKDREFTREDFGDDVPEELQREESIESEKPTVEVFSESGAPIAELPTTTVQSEIQISKSPDDELADFQIVEKEDIEEVIGSGGLGVEEPTIRPHSPVPPKWQTTIDQQQSLEAGPSADQPESGPSSAEPSAVYVQKGEEVRQRKSDDGSESSLQEFERLELEVGKTQQPHESPVSIGEEEAAEMVASATGSLNSLAEFENVEREIMEEQMVAAGGPEVMILSDIREESEVEEMSIHEDDDNPDSLNEAQERLVGQEQMLTSVDSLEPGTAHSRQHLMDTSVDSLEPTVLPGHADDSLLEGASHQENPSQDTQAMLSNDTAATFQEYHEDDRDSLEGVIGDYPTTLTTYETIQSRDDGTTETITRRVLTRITDPVHTHVQFTGTENADRLHNIQPEERVESVDQEGNITTTIRRQTPTL